MKVILIDEQAFFELFDRVITHVKEKLQKQERKWLTPEEAMKELGISSSTTLQKFRDQGKIKYSQPSKRIIRYDPESIQEFLESKSKNTF